MTDVITHVDGLTDHIDALWKSGFFLTYGGQRRTSLMDSEHDQETVGENPYWDIVRRLPLDPWLDREISVDGWPRTVDGNYVVTRDRIVKTYAWSIPSPGDIAWLKSVLDGRGVVEIGAGTGYWAWQLTQAGVDVAAYDIEPTGNLWCGSVGYHPVVAGGPTDASVYPDRALMLSWPPYGSPMAVQALSAYTGDMLIYLGEGDGGCTGDEAFFDLLQQEWTHAGTSPTHVTFAGMHCRLDVYRRVDSADGVS